MNKEEYKIYDTNDMVTLFNLKQIYTYIQNGVLPLIPPKVNDITKRIGFTFSKKETNLLYTKWLNHEL